MTKRSKELVRPLLSTLIVLLMVTTLASSEETGSDFDADILVELDAEFASGQHG